MNIADWNAETFFFIQVAADVVLCVAVLFVLSKVDREMKRRSSAVNPAQISALKVLIEESQKSTADLLKAIEESREAFRETSRTIEEKEARLKRLLEASSAQLDRLEKSPQPRQEPTTESRYDEVRRLSAQGFTAAEISESLGISEGEIRLILDLDRRKSDQR